MHILLTGGTGLIGSALRESLRSQGHQFTVLSRTPARVRDCAAVGSLSDVPTSERIDVIVNLAGAAISKRWSKAYKRQLLASRIDTTKAVVDLVARLEHKPKLLISARLLAITAVGAPRRLTKIRQLGMSLRMTCAAIGSARLSARVALSSACASCAWVWCSRRRVAPCALMCQL